LIITAIRKQASNREVQTLYVLYFDGPVSSGDEIGFFVFFSFLFSFIKRVNEKKFFFGLLL
jgi:hypothetical protein